MDETTKIYTSDNSLTNGALIGSMLSRGNNDLATLSAMSNGMNGQWNNPFIYLVWMMFANRYFGGEGGQGTTNALSNLIQDNHNSDLLMSAVNGSTAAVQDLAVAVNGNFAGVNAAICGVRNAITEANGNINLAAEKMLNGVILNGAQLGSKIQEVGCGIKSEILNQGYQNQLANCQQTNTIQAGFGNTNNVIAQAATALGFQLQTEACATRQTSTDNTQRIIDTLNNHWSLEQQTTIQQLRDEIGRLNQTTTLIAALKPATTTA